MSMKKMFVLDAAWSPTHINELISDWWGYSCLDNGVMVRGSIQDWMEDYEEDSNQYKVAKWIKETYTDITVEEEIGIHFEW